MDQENHDSGVTVVVPAFNEEEIIGEVVAELIQRYPEYEILVVNDGSSDRTAELVENLPCRLINHKVNSGYGSVWKTGCRHASGDVVVYFDGDGQFDPDDIEKVLDRFAETNADMVSGVRVKGTHTDFRRQPGKLVLREVANFLAKRKIPDLNCGLRAFNRTLLSRYLHLLPDSFSASSTSMLVFLKQGHKVEFQPLVVKKRAGTSSVNILRDGFSTLLLIVRIIALFDPLRIFLPISLVLIVVSILYSGYEIIRLSLGIPVLGAVLFIGGVLCFLLGILSDQISALRLERLE